MNFVLFHWICFIKMVLRHTAKSNLKSEIKFKRHSLPSLMGNIPFFLGATVTDFMAFLQSFDCSKFKRFSNVADEIAVKLL